MVLGPRDFEAGYIHKQQVHHLLFTDPELYYKLKC
jgi:hypothetical protein